MWLDMLSFYENSKAVLFSSQRRSWKGCKPKNLGSLTLTHYESWEDKEGKERHQSEIQTLNGQTGWLQQYIWEEICWLYKAWKWCHIFIGPRCPWGPIYGSWCLKLSTRLCWDSTDVTLADEDSNSIPTDDVNRAIPGNVAMQVAPSDGQHWN